MGYKGLIACAFCTLLASSCAQPTPGPSAGVGSKSAMTAIGAPVQGPASSTAETRDLTQTPFSRVALCAPFTVLVQPSEGYQVTIDADDAVKQAITTLIDGNTLLLESNAFTTTNLIKVTVGLPATALSAVTARGAFPATVAPGFIAPELAITASGTAALNVLGISTGVLTLVNSGTGSPVVTGNITSATVKNSGTGNLYVSGVNTSATITTSGTGDVYVLSANANVPLTGTSSGLGHVNYNQGTCNVQGMSWVFGPACRQVQFSMPDTSLSWTCGVQNTGRSACSGGSSSVSNIKNCPDSPVTYPVGQVSSYSVVDSKLGNALGLDTNTAPAQAGAVTGVPSSPLAVNGIANGVNNTPGTQNGQGNGQGSVGAGNGNQNGNNNSGSLNGNGNGIGNTGNGNGAGNGNGNTNPQG